MGKRKLIFISILIIILAMLPQVTSSAATKGKAKEHRANLVIFAYLSGSDAESDKTYFDGASDISSMNAGQRIISYYDGSRNSSLKNYMTTISYGQFEIHNIFPQYNEATGKITPLALSTSKTAASSQAIDPTLIVEVINKYSAGLKDAGGNTVSGLDYDNDGCIDNFTLVLVGGASATAASASIYPHASSFGGSQTINGKKIGTYNILSTYRVLGPTVGYGEGSGVIIHEYLHTRGYADLYNNVTNSHESDDQKLPAHPVYTWSIMGSDSRYVQWPLAYERMYFSDWLSIDTITSSQTVTLDVQGKADGNQAYIIESPLNDSEVFVIEYRKKNNVGTNETENELETKIGYPQNTTAGLIVYRVDKTVEKISNYHGETGIYVFRPMAGQNGYDTTYPSVCVMNAALSTTNNRTSIGSADMTKGIKDGALTFSDGSNSGIVITTDSTGNGDTMNATITFPDIDSSLLWDKVATVDIKNSYNNVLMDSIVYGENMVLAAANGNSVEVFKIADTTKTKLGATIAFQSSYNLFDIDLFTSEGNLYLALGDGLKTKIYSYTNSAWTMVKSFDNYGYFNYAVCNGTTYFTYVADYPTLAGFDGNTLTVIKEINENTNYCNPVLASDGSNLYVSVYNMAWGSSSKAEVFKLNGTSLTTFASVTCESAGYAMHAKAGKVYISIADTVNNKLEISQISENATVTKSTYDLDISDSSLTFFKDDIYFAYASSSDTGMTRVYKIDKGGNMSQFCKDVDRRSLYTKLTTLNNALYITYTNTSGIVVKRKSLGGTGTPNQPGGDDNPDGPNQPGSDDNPDNPQNPDAPDAQPCTHDYKIDKFTWSSDLKSCTALYVCSKDSSHRESRACSVSSYIKTTATPNRKGVRRYTASCGNDKATWDVSFEQIKSISLNFTQAVYTGNTIKPSVTIKDSANRTISSKNYSVSYTNCKNIGKGKVTVTFKGAYSGSLSKGLTIIPATPTISSTGKSTKGIRITWKRVASVDGYELSFATDKNFTKGKKSVIIASKTTSSKTVTGLKKGTKYYVRIRAYKVVNKVKYTSAWKKYSSTVRY